MTVEDLADPGARVDAPGAASVAAVGVIASVALAAVLAVRGGAPAIVWDLEVPLGCTVLAALGALAALDPAALLRRASALWLGWVVVLVLWTVARGAAAVDGPVDLLAQATLLHPLVPSTRHLGPPAGWLVAAAVWGPLLTWGAHHLIGRGCDLLDASPDERRWARAAGAGLLLLWSIVLPPLAAVAAAHAIAGPLPGAIGHSLRAVARWRWVVALAGAVLVIVGATEQTDGIIRLAQDRVQLAGSLVIATVVVAAAIRSDPERTGVWGQRCLTLVPGAVVGVAAGGALGAHLADLLLAPVLVAAVAVIACAAGLSPVVSGRAVVLRPALAPTERPRVLGAAAAAFVVAVALLAAGAPDRPVVMPVDGFERSDGAEAFGGGPIAWRQESGTWAILDGAAIPTETFFGRPLALVDAGAPDHVVRTEVAHLAAGMGVVARVVDPINLWLAVHDGHGLWQLVVVEGGGESVVAQVAAPTADGVTVELRADGERVSLRVGGRLVVSVLDDRHRTATSAGLAAPGDRYDGAAFGSAAVAPLTGG